MGPEEGSSFLGQWNFPILLLGKPLEAQVLLVTDQQYYFRTLFPLCLHWRGTEKGGFKWFTKMPVPKWGIKWALDFIARYYAMFLPARKQLCYSSNASKDNQPPVNTTYCCPGTICHFIQHLGETTPNKQHLVKQRNIHYSKRKNPTYNCGYDSAYKIRSTNLLGYAQPQMTMRLHIH